MLNYRLRKSGKPAKNENTIKYKYGISFKKLDLSDIKFLIAIFENLKDKCYIKRFDELTELISTLNDLIKND